MPEPVVRMQNFVTEIFENVQHFLSYLCSNIGKFFAHLHKNKCKYTQLGAKFTALLLCQQITLQCKINKPFYDVQNTADILLSYKGGLLFYSNTVIKIKQLHAFFLLICKLLFKLQKIVL